MRIESKLNALLDHLSNAVESGGEFDRELVTKALAEVMPSLPIEEQSTHTPGPWIVRPSSKPGNGTKWRDIVSIGEVYSPSYVGEALEQDAHLMAAAPALLKALRESLSEHQLVKAYLATRAKGDGTHLDRWLRTTQKAIAVCESAIIRAEPTK